MDLAQGSCTYFKPFPTFLRHPHFVLECSGLNQNLPILQFWWGISDDDDDDDPSDMAFSARKRRLSQIEEEEDEAIVIALPLHCPADMAQALSSTPIVTILDGDNSCVFKCRAVLHRSALSHQIHSCCPAGEGQGWRCRPRSDKGWWKGLLDMTRLVWYHIREPQRLDRTLCVWGR